MRAFAVLAVIAYHMKMSWMPGGLLGVTMFFVLSGYLITGLLLREYEQSGTISLKGFWLRRVRRIIPAVVFSVLGIAFLCLIFDHALLTKMRPDVLPTLLFVNNWWQIFHNISYFAALGEPSPLTHYWSLAIEEQFYVVWPVALLICLKAGAKEGTLCKGTIALAVLSALEMFVLFDPSIDPSRVYYGTDTRAFSLLIGSALAFLWPYQRLSENAGLNLSAGGRVAFNLVGVGAVGGLLVMTVVTNGFSPFIYRGGLLLCSLLTAAAIAVMVHPASWIGKVFQLKPLVFIGKISYSMYLWHYPLILMMTPNNLVGDAPIWLRLVQLVVIFAVSAFSYYVVENPIRKGAIGNFFREMTTRGFSFGSWLVAHVVPVVGGVAFVAVAIGGLVWGPTASSVNNVAVMGSAPEESSSASEEAKDDDTPQLKSGLDAVAPYDILLIGDSVPASMDGYGVFYEVFPYGHIDAMVSRPFSEGEVLYQQYRDVGAVGDVLVIALGTNGYLQDGDIDSLMNVIGSEQRVWFINTRSQTDFFEQNNETIRRATERYDNAELIDWYAQSAALGEGVFDGDGTHLTIDGCRDYAQMIKDAVGSYLPEHKEGEPTRDKAIEELTQKVERLSQDVQRVTLSVWGLQSDAPAPEAELGATDAPAEGEAAEAEAGAEA